MKKSIYSVAVMAIISLITVFILSKTINKQEITDLLNKSGSVKNVSFDTISSLPVRQPYVNTNINVIDSVKNQQNDSIKYLNETINEIKKKLEELSQQKNNSSKPKETVSENVTNLKPDTADVSRNITTQKLDTLTIKKIESGPIFEIKKELEELRQQKINSSKSIENVFRNVSNSKSDTAKLSRNGASQKLDTSTVKK